MEKEGVSESKITLIPHGFDLQAFSDPDPHHLKKMSAKYGLQEDMIIVGCIARYFQLKGIQYLIPAIKRLKQDYPKLHLMLFNAKGPFKAQIKELLNDLGESDYTEVAFEEDLFSIYALFDIYVHLPIDPEIEAFGQTYVEAMAASKACVFTLSGIAPEFVVNEENALVVPYEDSDAVYAALKRLLDDHGLKKRLQSNTVDAVRDYALDIFINRLEKLYLS